MPRDQGYIVPPIPRQMSPRERLAWRLWRSGQPIRLAAAKAKINPDHLRVLLGMAPLQWRNREIKTDVNRVTA